MKALTSWFHSLIGILISCTFLAGCKTYSLLKVDSGFIANEDGVKNFKVVHIVVNSGFPQSSHHSIDLVPEGETWKSNVELASLDQNTPPWRQLTQHSYCEGPILPDVIGRMINGETESTIKWVISVDPVVVGIGTDHLGVNPTLEVTSDVSLHTFNFGSLPYSVQLVTPADVNRGIKTLYISEAQGVNNGTIETLQIHGTIGQVLEEMPWKK